MATVVTSANIKAHWEPLIGEVDMGSQDTGLAHGFYDPETKTVFLIADHIEAGQEMAVAAHELMHKHGKAVLGERGWKQLHEVIGTWAGKPDGSLERQVYDEAVRRVDASRPAGADTASYSSEELFPYAVQEVKALGRTVQPSTYDFGTKQLFDPGQPGKLLNNAVARGVAKGMVGLSEAKSAGNHLYRMGGRIHPGNCR